MNIKGNVIDYDTDMKNLADIAPLVDDDIIQKFKNKYAKTEGHFSTHTANITNGLSHVTIYGVSDCGRKRRIITGKVNNNDCELVSHTNASTAEEM